MVLIRMCFTKMVLIFTDTIETITTQRASMETKKKIIDKERVNKAFRKNPWTV